MLRLLLLMSTVFFRPSMQVDWLVRLSYNLTCWCWTVHRHNSETPHFSALVYIVLICHYSLALVDSSDTVEEHHSDSDSSENEDSDPEDGDINQVVDFEYPFPGMGAFSIRMNILCHQGKPYTYILTNQLKNDICVQVGFPAII